MKFRVIGTLKYEISAQSLAKMAEIEGAIGRQFQSLSTVFVCAVDTKLASLFGLAPDIYEAAIQSTTHVRYPWNSLETTEVYAPVTNSVLAMRIKKAIHS